MRETFIIGDSHTTFFDRAGIMKSHWLGVINIATIYQLLKGLDIFNLTERLAKSEHYQKVGVYRWQCPGGVYDVPNIKEGDIVFFSFGFNDIQKNIYKYARNSHESEIYRLVNNYLLLLKEYKNITCIPVSIMPNPIEWLIDQSKIEYGCYGDFKAYGSSEERNGYTKYANKVLSELSLKYGLKFLDLYDDISENGFIRKDFTTDYVHLDYENKDVVEIVSSKSNIIIQ